MYDSATTMMLMASLGEELARARAEKGQTQKTAAAELGVSQPTYHLWETNQARPEHGKIGRIAEYVDRSVVEILASFRPEPIEVDEETGGVAAKAERLERELMAQAARITHIEHDLDEAQRELRQQSRIIMDLLSEVRRRGGKS